MVDHFSLTEQAHFPPMKCMPSILCASAFSALWFANTRRNTTQLSSTKLQAFRLMPPYAKSHWEKLIPLKYGKIHAAAEEARVSSIRYLIAGGHPQGTVTLRRCI